LTSPATGGGLRLLGDLAPGVTVTTGNALTAAVVCANTVEAATVLGLGRRARVAVVGCTGSVGVAASRLLADRGFPLHLVGRTPVRVRSLLGDLRGAEPAAGPACLARSDVIVLLTSAPEARLLPGHVRPGSVVIDCAQPANVAPEDLDAFARRRVAVVEGGLVTIPGFTCGFDFRLSRPGAAFACLAETYLFAREGLREHSVGRATVDQARRMERLAERRGIEPAPLARRDGRGAMAGVLGPVGPPGPRGRRPGWREASLREAPTEQSSVPRGTAAEA
jgi:predicted amino acid dehydrogenase